MKIFLKIFWTELVFNGIENIKILWAGWGLNRVETATHTESGWGERRWHGISRLGRRMAAGKRAKPLGMAGMECPDKGRRGGGHGADALGTVAFYGVNGRFGRDGLFG